MRWRYLIKQVRHRVILDLLDAGVGIRIGCQQLREFRPDGYYRPCYIGRVHLINV